MNRHDFEIAMTYGARGTLSKALEQLGQARRLEARDEDAAAAAGTFEHLMSVLRQAPPAAPSPAASEVTGMLQTPLNGTIIGVLNDVRARSSD